MMQFKVGDKVRMLRSSEEGVVIKIKGNLIDIETTDGFEFPVTASDLVLVSKAEEEYFRRNNEPLKPAEVKKEFIRKEAIFLAFEPLNDTQLRAWLVNETLKDIHAVLSIREKGVYINKFSTFLESQRESRIDIDISRLNFEDYSRLKIQLISFKEGSEFSNSQELEIQLKMNRIFRETKLFGPNRRSGYLYELDLNSKRDNLPAAKEENPYFSPVLLNQEKTIDLHADKLGITHLNAPAILTYQYDLFQKEFDLGISNDLMELTVIHGVGNGTLRSMIHKYISQNPHVEWFKDAQKEKFGYGATLIHYKA